MNILFLTNEINVADGVSSQLFYLIRELRKDPVLNISIISGGGDAIDKFKNTGVNVVINKNFKHQNRGVTNFLKSIFFLKRFVKKNNIQIIHSHNHYAANIAQYCPKSDSVKTIQTLHGYIPEGGKLKHFNAHHYIAVNDYLKDYLIKNNIAASDEITVIYNGIDFKMSHPEKNNTGIKIIAASRLEKGKGLEIFIEAIGKIPVEYRNIAEFIIAGSGSLKDNLTNLNADIKAGINFLDEVSDLRKILDSTDIFVMPSVSEGFPITLLEAAASGNFVIASDFEGIRSLLFDDSNGMIFSMNDPDELAGKIKFAIDNPGLIKSKAEKFYLHAKEFFNSERMTEKYITVYKQLIKN